jgi:TrmH family RNA methyltransferase
MSLVVVLHRSQDVVNIAVVIRAMLNFGLEHLRLVAPEEYDTHRIQGIAHKSGRMLKRIRLYDDLEEALADCIHVAGMSARQRAAKRTMQRPGEAAVELLATARTGTTALVLGPEDRGLTNQELDRCHRVITIPTAPELSSLNLAQAFTVMAYELFCARGGEAPFKRPRRAAPPAMHAEYERLFADAEAALDAVEFFKTRNPSMVMRTVREVGQRVPLDQREAKLLRAMCIEVVRYLERKGVR